MMDIWQNPSLIDISGIEGASINCQLYIHNNVNLSECSIQSVCNYLNNSFGGAIYDNAPGCNSPEEIDSLCNLISIENFETERFFSISPNPANNMLNISIANCIIEIIEIYNQTGQLLRKTKSNKSREQIDISALPPGNFFIRAISRDDVFVRKIVVMR
ncbi:MAG: T9SS type A sorting domain-containing protein [Bacteroidota bacterium]|nr:T9SS type A sorting domain-containing protein [Bacteroidota bacterium]